MNLFGVAYAEKRINLPRCTVVTYELSQIR